MIREIIDEAKELKKEDIEKSLKTRAKALKMDFSIPNMVMNSVSDWDKVFKYAKKEFKNDPEKTAGWLLNLWWNKK